MRRLGAWIAGAGLMAACSSPPLPRPDNREAAYRENNRGVAELEQYAYDKAVESFRRAIGLDDRVALPYLNLAIASYYAGALNEAQKAIEGARGKFPNSPNVAFVEGLIARASNRPEDAESAFKRVLATDPDEAAAMVNLGQLYLQDRRVDEAVAVLRTAVVREPSNATARYVLGQALIRSGEREQGARETARFETLRDSGAGLTYTQTYLEQGHYAEALVSTGLEPDLVDRAVPAVRFSDQTSVWHPRGEVPVEAVTPAVRAAVALTDIDLDLDLDLLVGDRRGVRLFKWANGRFDDVSESSGLRGLPTAVSGLVIADLDNDERPDLLLLHSRGIATRRQTLQGTFESFPRQPTVTIRPDSGALLDADHDGDLDIILGGLAASPGRSGLVLLRSDGQGAFTDVTAASRLTLDGRPLGVVPVDFDNRRDVDILAIVEGRPASLFQNQRDGSFRDLAAEVGLGPVLHGFSRITSCDLNKDGVADFVAAGESSRAMAALSDGRGRFAAREGPETSRGLSAIQCADYDNDGLLDIIGAGADGFRVLRNIGTELTDVTTSAIGDEARSFRSIVAMALGDVDQDGDLDIAAVNASGLRLFRNDGGSGHSSVQVRLKGRVSNRSGAGARVDVRAGSLWQRLERTSVSPAIGPETPSIGLGPHESADAIRVLWPAGILQAESAGVTNATTIVELDRKPSSCPFLYTWNGRSFEFVTDFLGGGELGYWEALGRYHHPDPDEFVRVTDSQLSPRNGRLELRVTNELEEVLYLDQVRLLTVDHPADVEVYAREGMRAVATRGLELIAVRNAQALANVRTDRGEDFTAQLATRDGSFTGGFVPRSIRGYAEPHDLIFETRAPAREGQSQALLLTGWTDYAFSSDNVAASHRGWTLEPPRLEIRDRGGSWRVLVADVGVPVGRPQTVMVEIGDAAKEGSQFRLRTNMRIHWDAMAIADVASDVRLAPRDHSLIHADLRWRGYSVIDDSIAPQPAIPNYDRVSPSSPWKVFPGPYTREGDVRSLVAHPDDLFVVARTGDEIALTFDASASSATSAFRRRTHFLGGLGFSKEMDMNSASPDVVLPLPARGLTRYPSVSPSIETRARQREMLERYNTRIVTRSIPHLRTADR
ncbi:MAG: FG-GAP-like repeat-containing protein [Vicinamibacterales bacterium]